MAKWSITERVKLKEKKNQGEQKVLTGSVIRSQSGKGGLVLVWSRFLVWGRLEDEISFARFALSAQVGAECCRFLVTGPLTDPLSRSVDRLFQRKIILSIKSIHPVFLLVVPFRVSPHSRSLCEFFGPG
jgi:hypothetical protein